MERVIWGLLFALAGMPAFEANDLVDKYSPFYYALLLPGIVLCIYLLVCLPLCLEYWEGLQLGGTICAGLLCIVGLLFILSGKCKCKNNQKQSPLPE